MAFANFTGSGHKTPNNPNNNNNNNNNQNPGQFQNPYFGGGQPTGDDVNQQNQFSIEMKLFYKH